MSNKIIVEKGADKRMSCNWRNANAVPIALTSVSVLCDFPSLEFTVIETDLANGIFEVKFEGTEPVLAGEYPFRIRGLSTGGDTIASPEVLLVVT